MRRDVLGLLLSAAPLAAICTILLVVLGGWSGPRASGLAPVRWGRAGPFYSVEQVCEHDGQLLLHLARFNCEPGHLSRQEADNYLAVAEFDDPHDGAGEGVVRLGKVSKYVHDFHLAKSRFIPVQGSPVVIQIQKVWRRETKVYHCDSATGRNRLLATLPNLIEQADYSTCAASRSGSGLVLVGPKDVTLVQPATGEVVRHLDPTLENLREFFVKQRGVTGDWYLSDDLRYVFCVQPDTDYHADGSSGTTLNSTGMSVGGVKVDNDGALAFDCLTHQFSTYIRNVSGTVFISDMEMVEGQLQSFHIYNSDWDGIARIADAHGHVVEQHDVRAPKSFSNIVGWYPTSGTIWYHIHERHEIELDENPDADHVLIVWDTRARQEKRYRLKTDAIRRAIEGAH